MRFSGTKYATFVWSMVVCANDNAANDDAAAPASQRLMPFMCAPPCLFAFFNDYREPLSTATSKTLRGISLVVVDEFLQRLLDRLVQRVITGLGIPRAGLPPGDVAGEFLVDGGLAIGGADELAGGRVLDLQVHADVGRIDLALGHGGDVARLLHVVLRDGSGDEVLGEEDLARLGHLGRRLHQ